MSSPPPPFLRYVVLHHTGHGEPHYDLMLEVSGEDRLATWRLPDWPPVDGMAITPLPPHRQAYMSYEGPVSHGRGTVRRVAEGTYEPTGDAGLCVRFDGQLDTWRLRDDRIVRVW